MILCRLLGHKPRDVYEKRRMVVRCARCGHRFKLAHPTEHALRHSFVRKGL